MRADVSDEALTAEAGRDRDVRSGHAGELRRNRGRVAGGDMKVRVTLKDPDTMPDAVDDAAKRLKKPDGITSSEWATLREQRAEEAKSIISEHWMDYAEYLEVEFDTDALTAKVIERGK